MTPQSPRQPAEILQSILANLTMAANAHIRTHNCITHSDGVKRYYAGKAEAFQEAIALIRVEAASLLTVAP